MVVLYMPNTTDVFVDGKSDLDLSPAELLVASGSVCFYASETCYCLLLPLGSIYTGSLCLCSCSLLQAQKSDPNMTVVVIVSGKA